MKINMFCIRRKDNKEFVKFNAHNQIKSYDHPSMATLYSDRKRAEKALEGKRDKVWLGRSHETLPTSELEIIEVEFTAKIKK